MRNAFEFVKSLDFVDIERIGIIGISLSGMVAIIFCSEQRGVKSISICAPAINRTRIIGKYKKKSRLKFHKHHIVLDGKRMSPDFLRRRGERSGGDDEGGLAAPEEISGSGNHFIACRGRGSLVSASPGLQRWGH